MASIFKDNTSLVFALGTVLFVGLAIVGTVNMYSPVPYWDMWSGYLDFYVKSTGGDWSAWWAQHNEHRIVLARMFFWLDIALFQGQGWFLLALNYVLLGMAGLVFWQASKEVTTGAIPWLGYFMLAWVFAWCQRENLTWAFQSQFVLALLLPLAGFYFLYRAAAATAPGNTHFALAALCGFLAMGSMANGVLALPLMTGYALLVRMGWKRCTLLAILSITSLYLYFYGYVSPGTGDAHIRDSQQNLLASFRYVLLYVGGPFYYFLGQGTAGKIMALAAGAFLISSCAIFGWRMVPRARSYRLPVALLAFVLYIGGTAFGTAWGRVELGAEQALSSRYMTPALMAWAALLVLYAPALAVMHRRRPRRIQAAFLLLLLLMLPGQLLALATKPDLLFERSVAALALELGVKDSEQVKTVYPSLEGAESISEIPVRRNLSVFGTVPIRDSRELLDASSTDSASLGEECEGSIGGVQPVDGDPRFLRVWGRYAGGTSVPVQEAATLSDDTGVVQGVVLTRMLQANGDSDFDRKSWGFKGYVRAKTNGHNLRLNDPASNCKVRVSVPLVLFRSSSAASSFSVNVSVSQILEQNDWSGSDFDHTRMPGMAIKGSYINSDSDTGSIVLRLKRGDKILYRSGPARGKQIAEVINAPHLVSTLPTATQWTQLEFSSDSLPDSFDLRLSDEGNEWGEWSAIALRSE